MEPKLVFGQEPTKVRPLPGFTLNSAVPFRSTAASPHRSLPFIHASFMSNYSIVMQSSPVAPKKAHRPESLRQKNGIVVSKPVEGKVTLSAVWSETNGTFENDLTPSLAKHLKETVHLLMTISYGQLDDGTGKVEAVYFIKMDPSGEAQRIAIEMDDISGPWTRKSAWPKKAIDWNA